MKYFILDAVIAEEHLNKPIFKTALKEHLKYLQASFDSGKILVSGPKANGGGIIIMKAEDIGEIYEFCNNDPPVKAGIKEYKVTEFKKHDCQDVVREWFEV